MAQQERIEHDIDIYEVSQPKKLTEDAVIVLLSRYAKQAKEPNTNYADRIINCLVHSVYLTEDKITIAYNITDGDNLLALEFDLLAEIEKRRNNAFFKGSSIETSGELQAQQGGFWSSLL